mmetsp:Transcript_822/g.1006  ORF Transcript_822/g.1006 Transcript_822/m.1006 type:complete len:196 (+) Transcript_822:145-732(+)
MDTADDYFKSAYEVAREKNIRKNREILLALGLVPNYASKEKLENGVEVKPKKKALKRKAETAIPTRRSRRLKNEPPENQSLKVENVSTGKENSDMFEITNDEIIRMKIERLKRFHEESGTSYRNPTATYDHTWMRVRTMSDKALSRRVRAIERACGQHCIVKMRMFGEVLILAGKDNIAKEATASLDRLLKLLEK